MYAHERSLVKQLADKPFALIGVNSDRNLKLIRKVVKEKNLTWRSFQNDQGDTSISDAWGIAGWPTVFILDAEGKIRFKGHGGDLDSVIEKLLAEMGEDVEIVHGDEEDDEEKDGKDNVEEEPEDSDVDDEEKKSSDDKDGSNDKKGADKDNDG